MQASAESEQPTKGRFVWLAIMAALLLGGATCGVLWLRETQAHNLTRADLQTQISDLQQHLEASEQLARDRLAALEQSDQEKTTLHEQLEDSLAHSNELTDQLTTSRKEVVAQTQRADAAEKQTTIEADRAEIGRRILSSTFFRLRTQQRKNPQYPSEELLEHATGQMKSIARGKAPEAEAAARHELGWIHYQHDRFDSAEQQTQIAVDLRRESLGPTHPDTLRSLQYLGNAMAMQGKSTEAIDAHRQALSGMRELYGTEPDRIRLQLGYLADALDIARRFEEAVPVWEEIVRLKRAASPGRYRTSLFFLAKTFQAAERYDEAETTFREVREIDLAHLGPDHRNSFASAVRLAWVLRLQDKQAEADLLEEKFASLAEFMLEIDQPFTNDSYGSYLAYRGRLEEAEFYLKRNYEREERVGTDGASINQFVYPLIELYEAWDKPYLADEFRQLIVGPNNRSG
ncbi:MAG: tetratricopeptide repeat protein [Planctomycetes bacterium]|nr:tetratricopeptide repeat protein [Planctomycetota bacterium]